MKVFENTCLSEFHVVYYSLFENIFLEPKMAFRLGWTVGNNEIKVDV